MLCHSYTHTFIKQILQSNVQKRLAMYDSNSQKLQPVRNRHEPNTKHRITRCFDYPSADRGINTPLQRRPQSSFPSTHHFVPACSFPCLSLNDFNSANCAAICPSTSSIGVACSRRLLPSTNGATMFLRANVEMQVYRPPC